MIAHQATSESLTLRVTTAKPRMNSSKASNESSKQVLAKNTTQSAQKTGMFASADKQRGVRVPAQNTH